MTSPTELELGTQHDEKLTIRVCTSVDIPCALSVAKVKSSSAVQVRSVTHIQIPKNKFPSWQLKLPAVSLDVFLLSVIVTLCLRSQRA